MIVKKRINRTDVFFHRMEQIFYTPVLNVTIYFMFPIIDFIFRKVQKQTKMNRLTPFALLFLIFLSTAENHAQESKPLNPEGVIRELYRLVTIEKGSTGDWDSVRALFIDEAVIVLRTSRTATSVFSLDGFVNDFVRFIDSYNIVETGFTETILSMNPWIYGDMAHVLVLYEAAIPGSEIPPNKGIDSFLLIRKEGEWKVTAITNEVPTPDNPIPPDLFK